MKIFPPRDTGEITGRCCRSASRLTAILREQPCRSLETLLRFRLNECDRMFREVSGGSKGRGGCFGDRLLEIVGILNCWIIFGLLETRGIFT